MGLRVITPPTVEPVTLDEVKQDLNIEHGDDDVKLMRHISDAREFIERRVQFKIAQQTLEYSLDAFPTSEILLPVGPAISITSVKYDDADVVEQTVPDTDYTLDNVSLQPWLFPQTTWPTALASANSVRIQYLAGEPPAGVPGPVKAAVRAKVQEFQDGVDRSRTIHDLLTNYYNMVA